MQQLEKQAYKRLYAAIVALIRLVLPVLTEATCNAHLPHVHEAHGHSFADICTLMVKGLKQPWQEFRALQLCQQVCTWHLLYCPANIFHTSLQAYVHRSSSAARHLLQFQKLQVQFHTS